MSHILTTQGTANVQEKTLPSLQKNKKKASSYRARRQNEKVILEVASEYYAPKDVCSFFQY